jgi:hypothetical protein
MKKHFTLFIIPLLILISGIWFVGDHQEIIESFRAVIAVMAVGAYFYVFMFFNTLSGHRVFGWKEVLKSWRVYFALFFVLVFLAAGLLFATAHSEFPQDDQRQHFFGWSLIAGVLLGTVYPIVAWWHYGFADELSYRQLLRIQGVSEEKIEEECERKRRQGIFAPRENDGQ